MDRGDFADNQMTLIMTTTNVHRLIQRCASTEYSILRNHMIVALDPHQILTAQHLEDVLGQCLSSLRNESQLLARHHLADQHIALVLRPAHVYHGAVLIVAAHHCLLGKGGVGRGLNPLVG